MRWTSGADGLCREDDVLESTLRGCCRVCGVFCCDCADVDDTEAFASDSSAQLLAGVDSEARDADEGVAEPEGAEFTVFVAGTDGERPLAACA